jgi:hypothetical protein
MHLEDKRLTAKYRASKMFFASHFGRNPVLSSILFKLKSYEPSCICPFF